MQYFREVIVSRGKTLSFFRFDSTDLRTFSDHIRTMRLKLGLNRQESAKLTRAYSITIYNSESKQALSP